MIVCLGFGRWNVPNGFKQAMNQLGLLQTIDGLSQCVAFLMVSPVRNAMEEATAAMRKAGEQ